MAARWARCVHMIVAVVVSSSVRAGVRVMANNTGVGNGRPIMVTTHPTTSDGLWLARYQDLPPLTPT